MAGQIKIKRSGGKSPESSDPLDNGIIEVVEIDEAPKQDPFAALFDDNEESITVDLVRVQPETLVDRDTNEIIPVTGFLESLPPNVANYYDYIQSKYGGGQYRGVKKKRGLIVTNFNIKISGRAKLPPSPVVSPAKTTDVDVNAGSVDGVNISGTNKEFENMLHRLMITKRILSDTDKAAAAGLDSNKLLDLIINRPESSPFKMLESTLGILSMLKEAAGVDGRETGASWIDVFNNALDKVGKLIDKKGGAPAVEANSGVRHLLEQKESLKEENAMPNYKQTAALAIAQIIASFNLNPRHNAKDAAECLDAVLSLKKEQRSEIKSFKPQLRNLALVELSKQFESDDEMQKEFTAYFDSVFDTYVNPERPEFSFEVK